MAATKKTTKNKPAEKTAERVTMAKTDDGTIQLTFSVEWDDIQKKLTEVAKEMGETIAVPGFRKGMAPVEKVMNHISRDKLIEHMLQHLLPELYAEAVKKFSLKPVTYPKFELLKASDDEPWEMRATTAEMPEIVLGDYKATVKGAAASKSIWTPDKAKDKDTDPGASKEEKEQAVIAALLENVKLTIPKMLIEEDVNSRLSQLLERIEKLGLNLDSYLASVGKTPQSLRQEYEVQSENTIKLELILNEIGDKENVTVEEAEINAFIEAALGDPSMADKFKTDEQKRVVASILRRRKVLDSLTAIG